MVIWAFATTAGRGMIGTVGGGCGTALLATQAAD
jgi:hypothetical protein